MQLYILKHSWPNFNGEILGIFTEKGLEKAVKKIIEENEVIHRGKETTKEHALQLFKERGFFNFEFENFNHQISVEAFVVDTYDNIRKQWSKNT